MPAINPGFVYVDRVPPAAAITSPAPSVQSTGTVTLSASASDNDKVASVQLKVDGSNVGAAVTTPPYQQSFDTRTLTDGAHTVTAVALDRIGNSTTATSSAWTTLNNIAWLGGGAATNAACTFPLTPSGALIVVGIFVSGDTLTSLTDNGGNGWSALAGGTAVTSPNGGGNLYVYVNASAAASSSISATSSAGGQINIVVGTWARVFGGTLQFASGITNWGRWAGPSSTDATSREVQVAVTWAGYDGGANNPSVSVAAPFNKREATIDNSATFGELALSDWITSAGGTNGPSGSTNNAADVYGAVAGFEGS